MAALEAVQLWVHLRNNSNPYHECKPSQRPHLRKESNQSQVSKSKNFTSSFFTAGQKIQKSPGIKTLRNQINQFHEKIFIT